MEQHMKVDSEKLRWLRETRGWSQEHLCALAGISVRTLQRMEADGSASAESRMAVAAALGLDAAQLCALPAPRTNPSAAEAPAKPSRRNAWKLHLAIYLLVCGALLLSDLGVSGSITWAFWPAFGWGIGLALHGLRLRRRSRTDRSSAGAAATFPGE